MKVSKSPSGLRVFFGVLGAGAAIAVAQSLTQNLNIVLSVLIVGCSGGLAYGLITWDWEEKALQWRRHRQNREESNSTHYTGSPPQPLSLGDSKPARNRPFWNIVIGLELVGLVAICLTAIAIYRSRQSPLINSLPEDRWERIKRLNAPEGTPVSKIYEELGPPDRVISSAETTVIAYSPFTLHSGRTYYRLNISTRAMKVVRVWRMAAPGDPPF